MTLITKTYPSYGTHVQISSFSTLGGVTEYQLLMSVTDPHLTFGTQFEHLQQTYNRVVSEELEGKPAAVFRRYFLSDAANQTDTVTEWECENALCALSIVQQPPLNGSKIALWVYLQTDVTVQSCPNGLFKVSHGSYQHLWGGGVNNKASNAEYQTRLLLNSYIMQLTEQGCTLASHCIRTWFFVQNVDVNYAGVVKARKEVFVTQNLTEKTHYIASTGIDGRHADPAVLVQMDTYAVAGIQPAQVHYLYAPTHLNPTYEYGVTFERGTAVCYGDRKHIFISGTASIDNRGEIVHPDNILLQTERMMENIRILLEEAGAALCDITQAIVYLRDPADYEPVSRYLQTHYSRLPHLIVHAPVCRPGWLIETECIAMFPAKCPEYPCL